MPAKKKAVATASTKSKGARKPTAKAVSKSSVAKKPGAKPVAAPARRGPARADFPALDPALDGIHSVLGPDGGTRREEWR